MDEKGEYKSIVQNNYYVTNKLMTVSLAMTH